MAGPAESPSTGRRLTVAACAPASFGFVAPEQVAATERMVAGQETDPAAIEAHAERFLDHHGRLLERAAGAGAQLAVLPEDILRLGELIRKHRSEAFCRAAVEAAQTRTAERIGTVCRRFGMAVAFGTATCRGGSFFNTAVLLDGGGQVVASYDKTHLPKPEREIYRAGDALPVFDTPVGRIGMLICWDIAFPETYAALALQGAELIVQPTFGHWEEADDIVARCRARDWSVPLAIGMWGGCAGIVDAEGNYLAHSGRTGDSLAVATLDLGTPRKWLWMTDARTEKLQDRRPELYVQPVGRDHT